VSQPSLFDRPPLTLSEIESHLWEAANILRGSPVDRTDYAKAKKLIQNFTQNMSVMTKHTGVKGDFFSREDTLKSIEEIVV